MVKSSYINGFHLRVVNGSFCCDLFETLLERLGHLVAHFTLDAVVNGVEDVVDDDARLVGRFCAVLVYTRLDENAVPVVFGLLIDGVGAAYVTLGGVADKVDGAGGLGNTVLGMTPLLHQARGEFEGRDLGLAKGVGVDLALALGEIVEGDFEHAAEGAHAQAHVFVCG